MKDKASMLENVKRSVGGQARKLKTLIAEGLGEYEKEARERAHLATTGDRPFVGCNPCQPEDIGLVSVPVTNPDAAPRPDTPDK